MAAPLFDAGDSSEATDQRGIIRPQGDADDIGAFELVQSYDVFLPFIITPSYPDLVVDSITVTGDADVEIVIRNSGTAPVTDFFWVDLYVGLLDNGNPPTQANETWPIFSPHGAVWLVTESLNAGDSLTLTVQDAFRNDIGAVILDNTDLYVQVDSADTSTTHGAVLETHEVNGGTYNNVFGPVNR